MNITISNILNFRSLYIKIKDQKFPLRTGYRLNHIQKVLEPHFDYYQEQFRNILDKFAEKDENGQIKIEDGNFHIVPDKIDECNEELSTLLSMEIEVTFKPLSIEELEALKLTMSEIDGIMPFISE